MVDIYINSSVGKRILHTIDWRLLRDISPTDTMYSIMTTGVTHIGMPW